jgi:hypothetical protein
MTTIFIGQILTASMDGQNQPNVAFRFQAIADTYPRIQPGKPISIQGSGDVATMMQQAASQAGLQFENNNVNVKLSNPYFWGSPAVMAAKIAEAAGVRHIIDKGTLAIWNHGQPRGSSNPIISRETGMVAYPTFSGPFIIVKVLFNPAIQYGGRITVQSDITAACGTWNVNRLQYDLESKMPNGRWFQTIFGTSNKGAAAATGGGGTGGTPLGQGGIGHA